MEGNEDILAEYNVTSLPTFVVLDSDGTFLGSTVGAKTETDMRNWLLPHIQASEAVDG